MDKKKTPTKTDEKTRSWLMSCELTTMTFNEEGYTARLPNAAAQRSSPAQQPSAAARRTTWCIDRK